MVAILPTSKLFIKFNLIFAVLSNLNQHFHNLFFVPIEHMSTPEIKFPFHPFRAHVIRKIVFRSHIKYPRIAHIRFRITNDIRL